MQEAAIDGAILGVWGHYAGDLSVDLLSHEINRERIFNPSHSKFGEMTATMVQFIITCSRAMRRGM
ncbi:MAG: hypothetical protein HXS40_02405 [Theionarchaea archaeon]|nr:hypothetical protein [Theionarchaea archaeon]